MKEFIWKGTMAEARSGEEIKCNFDSAIEMEGETWAVGTSKTERPGRLEEKDCVMDVGRRKNREHGRKDTGK